MALRVSCGLIRLWIVLSMLWIAGVGVVTWRAPPGKKNPPPPGFIIDQPTAPPFDPSKQYEEFDPAEFEQFKARQNASKMIERGVELALIPPILVLAIGSAFVWVVRGFR